MNIENTTLEIETQKKALYHLANYALNAAKPFARDAEVNILHSQGIGVSTRLGETENIEFNKDIALTITVYDKGRKGTASTNVLSKSAITKAINAAVDIMHYTSCDPHVGLGEVERMAFNAMNLDLFYPGNLDINNAVNLAKEAEKKALSFKKISGSEGGQYDSNHGIAVYANSMGMLESCASSRHTLSCSVISEEAGLMERNYAYTTARDHRDLVGAERVGQQAAERTIARLGARRIATTKTPVIFCKDVAGSLFAHLAGAIEGKAIYQRSSFLLASLHNKLFPSWFSIHEDPYINKGLGSASFDQEGMKTYQQDIIKNGVLQTYLLNNYSARRIGMASTGHAGGIYNWLFNATEPTLSHLLKKMNKGLLVTSLMGQGVNLITGDYSRGASGFWIENGEIQYPVNEITIAGNLKTMFSNLVAMSNDIETRSRIQAGSLLIEEMSIAGK